MKLPSGLAPQQRVGAAVAHDGALQGASEGEPWVLAWRMQCGTGAGWGPGCAHCWHWWVGGWWNIHHGTGDHCSTLANMQKAQEFPESQTALQDSSSAAATDTSAITKATKLPEFSSSKAEGKISDGLNHGLQMLLSFNCPNGAELCSNISPAFSNNFHKSLVFYPVPRIYGLLKLNHSKVVKCICSKVQKLV